MQLTGKQIVEREIIKNYCEEGVQQQGVDVRLISVKRVAGEGFVPVNGKTQIPSLSFDVKAYKEQGKYIFHLSPGYYEIEFVEGCNISSCNVLNFKTRSSLIRCGAEVKSGQFDAGFNTNHMGAFLKVTLPIQIEKNARIAQAVVTESYPVAQKDLYDGQWQNDKQRK